MRIQKVTALLLCSLGLLLTTPSRAQSAQDVESGRKHFYAGVNFLQDPDGQRLEEALEEFKQAYALSKNPKALGNLGYCALKLERDGEAIAAYEKYLESKGLEPAEREQVQRDFDTIKTGAVRLTLVLKGPPATITDTRTPARGQSIVNTYGPAEGTLVLLVRPGSHNIRVRVDGKDVSAWDFNGAGGAEITRELDTTPSVPQPVVVPILPPPQASSKIVPLGLLGLGGAALVAGGVTGILALNKANDLERRCPNDECGAGVTDRDKSSAQTLALVTDVLLVGGVAAALTGVTLLLVTNKTSSTSSRAQAGGGCASGTCMGHLRVAF